jgi:hypothetical protein
MRETIRCSNCRLNQYFPESGKCRRCAFDMRGEKITVREPAKLPEVQMKLYVSTDDCIVSEQMPKRKAIERESRSATYQTQLLITLPPSPRLRQVARLLRDGYTRAEIAAGLGITISAVKSSMRTIRNLYNAETDEQLVADLLLPLDSPLRRGQ